MMRPVGAGKRAVGVTHLFDYLDAYCEGRTTSGAIPEITQPAQATVVADAHDGLAQLAFAAALPTILTATKHCGIAAVWIHNCYTC